MKERYAILLAGMTLISVLFFWWSCDTMEKTQKDIDSKDKAIKKVTEQLNSATLMNEQLSHFSEVISQSLTTEDRFSTDELNQFRVLIDSLREINQIKLLKVSDAPKNAGADIIENSYNMEVEGTFQQIGQFLAELEKQNYIIKIQFLDISAAQASGRDEKVLTDSVNRYKLTLEMSLYKARKDVKES